MWVLHGNVNGLTSLSHICKISFGFICKLIDDELTANVPPANVSIGMLMLLVGFGVAVTSPVVRYAQIMLYLNNKASCY